MNRVESSFFRGETPPDKNLSSAVRRYRKLIGKMMWVLPDVHRYPETDQVPETGMESWSRKTDDGIDVYVARNGPIATEKLGWKSKVQMHPLLDTPGEVQQLTVTRYLLEKDGQLWREVYSTAGGVDHSGLIGPLEVAQVVVDIAKQKEGFSEEEIEESRAFRRISRDLATPGEIDDLVGKLGKWTGLDVTT